MSKFVKSLVVLIALGGFTAPAHAVDLISGEKPGSAASPDYPMPETKPSEATEGAAQVKPRKSFIPGHQSEYGGYVPGHYEEGPPQPPLAPGEKSQGYVPGHHDSQGRYIPGHPK